MDFLSTRLPIAGYVFMILLGSSRADASAPPGFIEGHLNIASQKGVELAEQGVSKGAAEGNYAEYPLIVLSKDGQKEITKVTPDASGNYRVSLPPGDYILDVQGRASKRVRAKPQPFTVVSNQTIRLDMNLDFAGRPN